MDGATMTVAQLNNLCGMLEIDIPECATTRASILKVLITHIFADCGEAERAEVLNVCIKPKAAKAVVQDNDLTHNVIAELSNDPENTDAVKEAKLALKDKKNES